MLGLSSLLGMGILWRYFSFNFDSHPVNFIDLGPVDNIPEKEVVPFPEDQVVIVRSDGTIKALSMVCPHLGCLVEMTEDGFTCPCHGSRFEFDGSLKKSPADRPLAILNTQISDEGHLIVKIT